MSNATTHDETATEETLVTIPPFVLPDAEQPPVRIPENPTDPYEFRVKTVAGTFTFRLGAIMDDVRIEQAAEDLLGRPLPLSMPGRPVPMHIRVARMLAELTTLCERTPPGWSWATFRNTDNLFDLWGGYSRQYATFRALVGGY